MIAGFLPRSSSELPLFRQPSQQRTEDPNASGFRRRRIALAAVLVLALALVLAVVVNSESRFEQQSGRFGRDVEEDGIFSGRGTGPGIEERGFCRVWGGGEKARVSAETMAKVRVLGDGSSLLGAPEQAILASARDVVLDMEGLLVFPEQFVQVLLGHHLRRWKPERDSTRNDYAETDRDRETETEIELCKKGRS